MADIDKMQSLVVHFRDEREWSKLYSPKDMAISLVLEASEFLEYFQFKDADALRKHLEKHKVDIEDEMADILYWIFLMAEEFNIDLSQAFINKMQKNVRKHPVVKPKARQIPA
jgi:NTP pyrophosphatase (non-canonical NTP hydrolase)